MLEFLGLNNDIDKNFFGCKAAYAKSDLLFHQYLTNVQCWNRRFGCETIHPTQKLTSMNLLHMSCVITLAWSFLTTEVVEADGGHKHHISAHTLTQHLVHPSVPVLLTKDLPRNEISYDFQPPISLQSFSVSFSVPSILRSYINF